MTGLQRLPELDVVQAAGVPHPAVEVQLPVRVDRQGGSAIGFIGAIPVPPAGMTMPASGSSSRTKSPGRTLQPRTVKRVLDALRDDPAHPWTLADMVALAGTSVRRLQEGFAEYVRCTPTATLRDIRLGRAHDDLIAGGTSVTDVAAMWGFSSPSRFAAAYRRRYGRSPSQDLRG